ncbi:glycosyltransferase [Methanobrevibacter sp. DSM 116169]|uniref:glycosyltransferase n=1 Tax=Methanobrevibacter sp. DSM 116169 TaxID=3242727 RepID=UPI0038FCF578
MKKVLLIAFYFNQQNEIGSKRLRAIAEYLNNFNWEPIVVVPKLSNKPQNIPDIKVIETDYIDMLDKWLNRKPNFDNQAINTQTNENKITKNLIHIAGELFAYPDGMKYWYEPAFKATSDIIEKEEIDAIISSSWPITSHKIAHNLKLKYNIPWIADLRDLWNMNPYISHNFIRQYFEKRLEIKTFSNVDALTTTTPLASKKLQTLHPDKLIKTIYSGYDLRDFENLKENSSDDKLNFIYAGSLYNGRRDPSLFFKAINELISENKIDKNKIAIDFYGDNDNLSDLSSKFNIKDLVHIHGKIPYNEVLQKEKNSDILLLISWMNKKEEIFIPGKVYEYMALKKPVLSIGYEKGALKDLINETDIGVHVSTLEYTKIAIYNYYKEFIKDNKLNYNGRIDDFSNYNMSKSFSELLNQVIK